MFKIRKGIPHLKGRLYVDMDGVLVDFYSGVNRLNDATRAAYANDPKNAPGVFALMDPMPGAIEAINRLADIFDVYILSTAPWNNPSAWSDKLNWVKLHLGDKFKKRLILSHHKDLLNGDFLIDDWDKHGTSSFQGKWIRFGSPEFPDWDAVEAYLMDHTEF
jgi:5'(3')-deoxyribonucleotidase